MQQTCRGSANGPRSALREDANVDSQQTTARWLSFRGKPAFQGMNMNNQSTKRTDAPRTLRLMRDLADELPSKSKGLENAS